MLEEQWIEHVLKIELHCHLLGVIGPRLLRRLGSEQLANIRELEKIYPVVGTAGFNDWLRLTAPYQTAPLELLLEILELHVTDLIDQHVVYTELMLSPTMFPRSLDAKLLAFGQIAARKTVWEHSGIHVEFLMVLPRSLPEEKLVSDTQTFIELHREGCIVGVALVGLETGESIARFKSSFFRLKDQGLGIEIHAGEHSGPVSVWEALDFGCADRIGHGISAFEDPRLVERLRKDNIHMEFCPSSNLSTGSVADLSAHPIRLAVEQGLAFSINTDDPGIFDCSMNSEFQLLRDQLNFTLADFERVFRHAAAAAFSERFRHVHRVG